MTFLARARAFAPAHATGLFAIYPNGSTGAGLNLSDGAISEVTIESSEKPQVTLLLNDEESAAPVSRETMKGYQSFIDRTLAEGKSIHIRQNTGFPIGFGLGMSGAGSFSLSLALNQALACGYDYKQCQKFAHDAEIVCGTGLGTVMSQEFWGMMIGKKPYPSTAVLSPVSKKQDIVCAFFEPIETASIIRNPNWKSTINQIGLWCMEELEKEPSADRIIELSRYFTEKAQLAGKNVQEAMRLVPEASMAMLGQTVFALTDRADEVERIFRTLTSQVKRSSLATHGAKIL